MWQPSGAQVWPPGSPMGDDGFPSLRDIGGGLGRQPRFAGGGVDTWYPVLCHTATVAALCPVRSRPYAWLHDAPEGVLGDMPKPWKTPEIEAREAHLLYRILRANQLLCAEPHGIYMDFHHPLSDYRPASLVEKQIWMDVKTADALAVTAEAEVLGFEKAEWFVNHYFPDHDTEPKIQEALQFAVDSTKRQLNYCRDFLEINHAGPWFEREVNKAIEEARNAEGK